MILPILKYPHSILRTSCAYVTKFEQELRAFVNNMFETMYEAHGLGLAANQVGVLYRVFVIDTEEDGKLTFVNPALLDAIGSIDSDEGCLSLPGVRSKVKRCKSVVVKWQNTHGLFYERTFKGISAIAIQHELDHLNGKMFIDRLGFIGRRRLLRQYEERNLS